MSQSISGNPLEDREKRNLVLSEMETKSKEMLTKLGSEYSIWDLISLACMILMQVSPTVPPILRPLKHIIGVFVDGEIISRQDEKKEKENLKNGILPFKS